MPSILNKNPRADGGEITLIGAQRGGGAGVASRAGQPPDYSDFIFLICRPVCVNRVVAVCEGRGIDAGFN